MGYRSYSYEDYENAMELFNKGFGPTEISRMLGIPKYVVEKWKYEGRMPWLARWTPEPSSELAYVIGVLLGDGCIIKKHEHNYDIELSVKDYEFAEKFGRALSKVLNKKFKEPYWNKSHNLWRVYYTSKAFHQWFKKQKLDSLKKFIEYDRGTVKYFLRGLYDSEGYNYKCRQIRLSNNDIELLYYIHYLLKKYFNIKATGPYLNIRAGSIGMKKNGERIKRNHNNYIIMISRRRDIQVFLSEVGFSITEKQLGLKRREK